ncbi:hypothetical protein BKA61DRAFT_621254, partial [Leptodontidium sp. MPI-SDFR-AT-0119]
QEALISPGPQRIFRDRDIYVHIVILSFSWNYSSAECCILDPPTNTDAEQCIPVAISRFQAYAGSTSLAQDYSSTIKSLAQDPSTVALSITRGELTTAESSSNHSPNIENLPNRLSTNTNILPSQDHPANISNAPNGTPQPSPPSKTNRGTKRKRPRNDEELVQDTAAWLKVGINKLSTESSPGFVDLSSKDFPYSEANACAMYLWSCAESHIIADINIAKGSMLNQIARIIKPRREAFISGVVAALKEHPAPRNVETVSLFNPTIILGRLLP